MKNLVFITIDSLSFDILMNHPCKDDLFIFNTLYKKSKFYTNIYTQGLYTEASMNGLFSGQKSLDNFGQLFQFSKSPTNLFKELNKNNYNIFCMGLISNYVDYNTKYNSYGPYFLKDVLWNRIELYKNLGSECITISQKEYIKNELIFATKKCVQFLNDIIDKKPCVSEIVDHFNYNDCLDKVEEYKDFLDFIESSNANNLYKLLKTGELKSLTPKTLIPSYSKTILENKKLRKILIKIKNKMLLNIFFKSHFLKALLKKGVKNLKNNQIFDCVKAYNNFISTGFYLKPVTSFEKEIDASINWIQSNAEKNFCIYLQPDDFHPVSTFFTYDKQISDDDINELVVNYKKCKRKNGNLSQYLSIMYIDKNIKRLYEKLNSLNLLNDTVICLTADHGSWEKNSNINLFDDYKLDEERIHVPFLVFSNDFSQESFTSFNLNSVIPNKLLEYIDLKSSKFMDSFLDNNDFVLCEHLGFGCPDFNLKPISYVFVNRNFKAYIDCFISREASIDDIHLVLDRKDKCISINDELKADVVFAVNKRHKVISKKCFYNLDMYDLFNENFYKTLEN